MSLYFDEYDREVSAFPDHIVTMMTKLTTYVVKGQDEKLLLTLSSLSPDDARYYVRLTWEKFYSGTLLHLAVRHQHDGRCSCDAPQDRRFVREHCDQIFTDSRRLEIVAILLCFGADKSQIDYYERTAFSTASADLFFSNKAHECLEPLLAMVKP